MAERRVAPAALEAYTAAILVGLGARAADASRVATALVDADRVGHRSHGVRQLPYYAGQIARGEIVLDAEPEIVSDQGRFVVVDGRRGFGHVVADVTARLAADRAAEHRVAVVAVRNANHVGRLGEYTELAAGRGQIALLLANFQGSSQQLAPFGGIDRRLTNNPVSVAVPGPDHPIALDMALSVVAESRIFHAAERGEPVPEGWILDGDGHPTTRPEDYLAGGTLVPVGGATGGYKGYGLIVVVELIVAMLSGGGLCGPGDAPFSNAYVLVCIDPGPEHLRQAEVAEFVAWVKSSRLAPGSSEIVLPGELEARRRTAAADAVTLDEVTVEALADLARSAGVEPAAFDGSERLGS